ncbi:dihydroneopterin aldolase / 2-amino-4-hydroxy-6-hydroxymethyldihydropteridine diphosphokinase [Quadrisphaera granulorum]|uniref:Bifunctional folate synthesis protein n=1 Tax=Quadrisphaera granulorum TaxID=317664 RepID=A0A316A6T7_9ACTN|nr:2-amino-4-hydroxy-6-hydroxymethyldihydropteridine diphosphokinase [Quadrisphaera granulorum]PWJ53303.1 dihydroneopterin aldolase/2-amino-4-hydroxy-6-hydroxymethyldihydropteridine diphosphokinase [Quadrisphaera granulorum]SZE96977.1 dihydroneopterin aldolase / 2-amino-4-hydroxy-6-hydroxymethyldihydropteridine diphosphokinase [Quadrisphaera granulorum]
MSGLLSGELAGDVVSLRGLRARGRHGVLDAERELGQVFIADIDLAVDTRTAAVTDDLGDAVDYSLVAADVVAVLSGEPVNLIEVLAGRVAAACLAHAGVSAVAVAVHKPQAPVGVPFDDVVITVVRRRADLLDATPARPVDAVVALGSNLGDRAAVLAAAVADLAATDGLEVVGVSGVVETAAVGLPGSEPQPDYLNAVVRLRSALSPRDLLRACRAVEAAHGRGAAVRAVEPRWGARTLDVDVLTCGVLVAADGPGPDDGDGGAPALQLPHPRAGVRAFVLVPWARLAPDDVLPGAGRVADVLAELAAADPSAVADVRSRPDIVLPGSNPRGWRSGAARATGSTSDAGSGA